MRHLQTAASFVGTDGAMDAIGEEWYRAEKERKLQ